MKRPPVSSPRVPAAVARAGADQIGTGTTEMPVVRPPGASSVLACHHWAQVWNASCPIPAGVQALV